MLPSFIARDMQSGLFRQVELALNGINGPVFAQRQIYTMATINLTVSSLQMYLLKTVCLRMRSLERISQDTLVTTLFYLERLLTKMV